MVSIEAFSQNRNDFKVYSQIEILNKLSTSFEIRNSTLDFFENKKSKKREARLTINRIQKKVNLSNIETTERDTVKYESDGFLVDTDNPIPIGENDKTLIENLVKFTDSKITFKESNDGKLIGPKIKPGNTNIENMFFSKLPILNSNSFLSPIFLNFEEEVISKTDTLISNIHKGIFVNNYEKNDGGYTINGFFIPIKSIVPNENENFATENYEYIKYSGIIKNNGKRINYMELDYEAKYQIVFRLISLNESKTEKLKIKIENRFENY
jgi:hypothetical protein